MNYFLKKCKANTLFLTGMNLEQDQILSPNSALAEIFLEEFYERNAYGIITTHYTNLKLLANEFTHNKHACALLEKVSSQYKLVLGEAGSSFTFEVAQAEKCIPYGLINKAKKLKKVKLDLIEP